MLAKFLYVSPLARMPRLDIPVINSKNPLFFKSIYTYSILVEKMSK